MLRRGFLGVLGVAAAWPTAAHAQGGTPVIGYLSSGSAQGFTTRLAAFRRGLRGDRLSRGSKRRHRIPLGRRKRRATADDGCRTGAAWRECFGHARRRQCGFGGQGGNNDNPDRVRDWSKSGEHRTCRKHELGPTGNITGVSSLNVEVGPKRFDLLRQLRPTATVVAVLVNPSNPNSKAVLEEARQASQALNLQLEILQASSERDFDGAFAKLAELHIGGLVVAPDPFFISRSGQLAALTIQHAVVAIFHTREFVAAGGLMSYGGSTAELHRQAGIYTGRILKGDRPADLPIQQVTKVELFINLNTAKALGLTVPPTLLATADEVIE